MAADVDAMAGVVAQAIKAAVGQVLERVAAAEARLSMLGDVRDRVVALETKAAAPLQPDASIADVRDRLIVLETKVAQPVPAAALTATPDVELRDRIVTLETKAAMSVPQPELTPVDLTPILTRLTAAELVLERIKAEGAWHSGIEPRLADVRERVAALEARPLVPGPQGDPGPAGKDGVNGQDGAAGLSFEGVYQEGQSYEKGHLVTWAGSSWHCNEPTTSKPGDGSKAWTLMVKRGRDGKDGVNGRDLVPVVKVGA